MELESYITFGQGTSDITGFIQDGREFAVVGLQNAAAFVDITDPFNPFEVGRIGGTPNSWRDLKYWNRHVYIGTDAEEFPHYGNPSYIRRQPYPLLGRDIVRLKTVCWLYFKKNLPQVPAGKYQVSLHFQLRADLSWPSVGGSSTAQLTVFKENVDKSEPPLADVVMESEYWKKIKCDKFDIGLLGGKANIIKSSHSDGGEEWFFIKFKPFTILQDTNLAFEWKDIDNPYWKRGMCWDYIQIEKV